MRGMAISDSLIADAQDPIEAIDCPNAEKNARKPPTSSSSLLFEKRRGRKNDERRHQRIRRFKNRQDVGGLLRHDEISLLCRKLFRPYRKRPSGRIGNAELSDTGNQLQHEAADLALLTEVPVFVIEAYRAGRLISNALTSVSATAISASLRS